MRGGMANEREKEWEKKKRKVIAPLGPLSCCLELRAAPGL